MKKILTILLICMMVLGLAACDEEEKELRMVSTSNSDFVITDGYRFATKSTNGSAVFKVYYGDRQLAANEYSYSVYTIEGNPSGDIGIDLNTGLFHCWNPRQEGIFGINITYGTHVLQTGWLIEEL